jgi:hypothetical protein
MQDLFLCLGRGIDGVVPWLQHGCEHLRGCLWIDVGHESVSYNELLV